MYIDEKRSELKKADVTMSEGSSTISGNVSIREEQKKEDQEIIKEQPEILTKAVDNYGYVLHSLSFGQKVVIGDGRILPMMYVFFEPEMAELSIKYRFLVQSMMLYFMTR